MSYCVIPSCNKLKGSGSISFHKFPEFKPVREKWIEFLNTSLPSGSRTKKVTKYSKVCSRHFQPCCFITTGRTKLILQNHFPHKINGQNLQGVLGPHVCAAENGLRDFGPGTPRNPISTPRNPTSTPENPISTPENPTSTPGNPAENLELLQAQITNVEEALDSALSQIRVLKTELNVKNSKILSLERKLTRSSKDPCTKPETKDSMTQTTCPSLLQLSTSETNGSFNEVICNLVQRSHEPKGANYNDLLKTIGTKIHFYSPKAYDYIRKLLSMNLPHPINFSRWTSGIETRPGFFPSALSFIKNRTMECKQMLYFAISFDEVNIRKQVIYHKGVMRGFTDYAGFYPEKNEVIATHALFIKATEINGDKKLPLGYVLTDGLSSNLLQAVITRTLEKMHENGAHVLTCTFDGLASNFGAAQNLGCNFDVFSDDFNTSITHPKSSDPVHVIPDPCHMTKLLRNTWESCEILIDYNGQEIKWEYLEKLQEIQTTEGLKAGNKLTPRHIKFSKQKMKVKLAVQLLSNSTAASLRFCHKLGLEGFEDCLPTASFIQRVDRLFDILNSTPKGKGYNAPLSKYNWTSNKKFLEETKNYLMGLKIASTGELLVKSRKKTCVLGLIVAIQSIIQIMENDILPEKTALKYLPVYKTSQDTLELFFSVLRQRFGNNNNPNVVDLEYALKKLLVVTFKLPNTGNCISQEEEVSTQVSPFLRLTKTVPEEEFICPTLPSYQVLSGFILNVVAYLSGFVAKRVTQKLKCELCAYSLVSCDQEWIHFRDDFLLLREKNNGRLFAPSEDLVRACRITELVIREFQTRGISKSNQESITKQSLVHILKEKIFDELRREYSDDHNPLFGDHVMVLLEMVVKEYTKIRLHHIAKEESFAINPTSNRSQLTKAIHFSGQ